MDIRPYNPKRQLIDVTEFLGLKDDNYLFCISGSMLYALRKLAKTRLLWRTSYIKTAHDQYYELATEAEFDQIDELVSEFIADSEVVEMCNQSLISALEDIASSVRLSSCCATQGAGGQYIGEDFYYGTADPADEPQSFGEGEEFATEAEYNAQRCAAANGIVNGLIGTLNGFSVLSLASLTVGAAALGIIGLGLLVSIPPALIIAVIATGVLFSAFSSIASELSDNHDELVCILYESDSATDAYDNLSSYVEDIAVDIGIIEIGIEPIKALIMNLAPIDAMNALYTSVGLPAIPGDIYDCDDCEPAGCTYVYCYHGVWDDETKIADSAYESSSGYEAVYIRFNYDPSVPEFCGSTLSTEWIELDAPYPTNTNKGHRMLNQSSVTQYQSDSPPGGIINNCATYWGTDLGANPFSIEFTQGV